MIKEVYIKSYTSDGTYKGTFSDFQWAGFSKSINSGVGQVQITVPRKFDDYNSDGAIAPNNKIEIYVADGDAPSGTLIYSGYIAEINTAAAAEEGVRLKVFGYFSKLALDIVKDGTQIGVKYRQASYADISDIFEDLIDKYKTANASTPIDYTGSSISSGGKQVSIDFSTSTYTDAFSELRRLADSDYYYYLDATNTFNFSQFSSTADHLFVFERDISSIKISQSLVDMRNGIIFWNGLQEEDPDFIAKYQENATSISSYGRQIEIRRDGRFKDEASVDEWNTRYLNANSEPITQVQLRLIDNNLSDSRVDLEALQPGQTCKILNISENDALSDNMLITGINYQIDYADIVIQDTRQFVDRNLFQLKKFINERTYSDSGPVNYTT